MDGPEVEAIAAKVSEQVVHRLFLILGVDVSDPTQLIKLQKDLAHLRGWRESVEIVRGKTLAAMAGFIVTGVLGYIVFMLTKH